MGRGEGWIEVSFVPPGWSVNGLVVTGQILKNLRATISQGKDKNFPK